MSSLRAARKIQRGKYDPKQFTVDCSLPLTAVLIETSGGGVARGGSGGGGKDCERTRKWECDLV